MTYREDELREALKNSNDALMRVASERDAYRALQGKSIGSGINLEEYELVFRHKLCAQIVTFPHFCEGERMEELARDHDGLDEFYD